MDFSNITVEPKDYQPSLLFTETLEHSNNNTSIGSAEIRFKKPIILGQLVFHVNGQPVVELDHIMGASTQNIATLNKKKISLTTEDCTIRNIQVFAKNLAHPADKFEKILTIPSYKLHKDGKALRVPLVMAKTKEDYHKTAKDACQELMQKQGLSITTENLEDFYTNWFSSQPSLYRLMLINEQKFLTNHLFLRGVYEKLTISIYGWVPDKDTQNKAMENEFEINVNHLQIHSNYRNAFDSTTLLTTEATKRKSSYDDYSKDEAKMRDETMELWVEQQLTLIRSEQWRSQPKYMDSLHPQMKDDGRPMPKIKNMDEFLKSNMSLINKVTEIKKDQDNIVEQESVGKDPEEMCDQMEDVKDTTDPLAKKENENNDLTQTQIDTQKIDSLKGIELNEVNDSVENENANDNLYNEEEKDNEVIEDLKDAKEKQETDDMVDAVGVNNTTVKNEMSELIDEANDTKLKPNLHVYINNKFKTSVKSHPFYNRDSFLFNYLNLDHDTFFNVLSQFEKILYDVNKIIYDIYDDKVQTLQIKLNTLKEKILFLRKYVLKNEPYYTMQVMYFFKNSIDKEDFIFSTETKKKLANILKYGLEGKICNHYERLFVLQVATYAIEIDPSLKKEFEDRYIIFKLLWVINEEVYDQSMDFVYYYAAKLLVYTYSLVSNKIIYEHNLVEYSDSKNFKNFLQQNFIFYDEYHSDRKSFFDNVEYNYKYEKKIADLKVTEETKYKFKKLGEPKPQYTYLMQTGIELLMAKYTKNNVSDRTLRKLNFIFLLNKICYECNKIKKYSNKMKTYIYTEFNMSSLFIYLKKCIESLEVIFRNFELYFTDLKNYKKDSKFKYIFIILDILANDFNIFEYLYLVHSISELLNYNIEWECYLNFFAYLTRINFTSQMYHKSAILYKITKKAPQNAKELVTRYADIVAAHERIHLVLNKQQYFQDYLSICPVIFSDLVSEDFRKIYLLTIFHHTQTTLSLFQADLLRVEYLTTMVETNYVLTYQFFKTMKPLTQDHMPMPNNLAAYNICIRLNNEYKIYHSPDMDKKIKNLIKDYQLFLNHVLKTHEPTKEIKTYESFLFTSTHVNEFLSLLRKEKRILYFKTALYLINNCIQSQVDMECLWYNNFIRYNNIMFCITVKSLEHALFSFKHDVNLAHKFDYWRNIIVELYDYSLALLKMIESFCNCIGYTDFNEIVSYFDDILIKSLFNFYGLLVYLRKIIYVDSEVYAVIECNLIKIFIKPKFMEYYIAWMLEFCYLCSDQYTQIRQYLFVKIFTLTFRKNIMFIFENKLPELSADKLYHKEMIPIYKILDRTTGVFKNIFDVVYHTNFPLCRIANCNMFETVCFESNYNHNIFIYNFLVEKLRGGGRPDATEVVLYYLASIVKLPQVKCIFIAKNFIIEHRQLLVDASSHYQNVWHILEVIKGIMDEAVYLSWFDSKEDKTKKTGKYLDENSIIVAIDLMVIIYKCFTGVHFEQLAHVWESLGSIVDADMDKALEDSSDQMFDNQARRREALEQRRKERVEELLAEKKKLFLENQDQIKRRKTEERAKDEASEHGTDLKYEVNRHYEKQEINENMFDENSLDANMQKQEANVYPTDPAVQESSPMSDGGKDDIADPQNVSNSVNSINDGLDTVDIDHQAQSNQDAVPKLNNNMINLDDDEESMIDVPHVDKKSDNGYLSENGNNSIKTASPNKDVTDEDKDNMGDIAIENGNENEELAEFDESQYRSAITDLVNEEVQMTAAEVEEELKDKEHLEYIKRVEVDKAVGVIRVYLKSKYEYFLKIMYKFIELYTIIFNSKLGLYSLLNTANAYKIPTIRDLFGVVQKVTTLFGFQVGIELVDSFLKLITAVSDKLKETESFSAYEIIFGEKINNSIDGVCEVIISTLKESNDATKIEGYINHFNTFKISYNENYNTDDARINLDKVREDPSTGAIEDLKLAIESYFEFKNSNKTEDLRLNNNQYFLSTYCKKNLIDDLHDIQSYRYDIRHVFTVLDIHTQQDTLELLMQRLYSKRVNKWNIDHFYMERFSTPSTQFAGILLSEDEPKHASTDDNHLKSDSLMDYAHFEKITMALVDEAQLSTIKERRKQAEEDKGTGIHSRELSTHVDQFRNSQLNELNKTEDDAESRHSSKGQGNGRTVTRKLLIEETNAKQRAMEAMSKMFKGAGSMGVEEGAKRNDIIYINSVPENLKSGGEQGERQLQYNKGLSRQANHTLQKINNYGMNNLYNRVQQGGGGGADDTVLNINLGRNRGNHSGHHGGHHGGQHHGGHNHHNRNHNHNHNHSMNQNHNPGEMNPQSQGNNLNSSIHLQSQNQNSQIPIDNKPEVKKEDKLSLMKSILSNFGKK